MSKLRQEQDWLMTASLMVLALYATCAMLVYTQAVMIPFVLAVMIVSLMSPLVDYQVSRLRLPHAVAVSVAVVIVLMIAFVLGLILINAMQAVASKAVAYSDSFGAMLEQGIAVAERWGYNIDRDSLLTDIRDALAAQMTNVVLPVLDIFSKSVLVLIFVVFLSLGRVPFTTRDGIYVELDRQVRQYIGVKVALSALTGFSVWLVLTAMGLELASVFGILAFILNFIPVIGSVIATLLPIPMAVAQYQSVGWVIAVVAVPGAIQQIVGNGLEPKLLGRGLSLHPVTVVMSLALWGLLWGGAGMLLAVPMTAILRIVLLKFESVRPIGRLLGGELPNFRSDQTTAPM